MEGVAIKDSEEASLQCSTYLRISHSYMEYSHRELIEHALVHEGVHMMQMDMESTLK